MSFWIRTLDLKNSDSVKLEVTLQPMHLGKEFVSKTPVTTQTFERSAEGGHKKKLGYHLF